MKWWSRFAVALFYSFKHVMKAVCYAIGIVMLLYVMFATLDWMSCSAFGNILVFVVQGVCAVWLFLMLILIALVVLIFKREVENDLEKIGWDFDE